MRHVLLAIASGTLAMALALYVFRRDPMLALPPFVAGAALLVAARRVKPRDERL